MTARERFRRRLSRRFNRVLFRVYRLVLPTTAPRGPLPPASLRRILVHPNEALGDLLVTTPVLSYLRAVAPQARIDVLATGRNAALLEGDPRVDRVVPFAARGWRMLPAVPVLRRERYDLIVVCVFGKHIPEGWIAGLAARRHTARATVYRPPQYRGFWTHLGRVPGYDRRTMPERFLHVVQHAVYDGTPPAFPETDRYPLSVAVPPDAAARVDAFVRTLPPGPFVAVNCWSTIPNRSMQDGQAGEILAALAAAHPELAFVLTPHPRADADAVVRTTHAAARRLGFADPRLFVFPPSPRLVDLAALVARAAIVLTPDTANVHLASAVGTPVVALYRALSDGKPNPWRPFGVAHRVVALPTTRPVGEIPPAMVTEAFASLWAEVDDPTTPRGAAQPAGARGAAR
ncbi:glycosyl transferase [Gemmatimonadetes bacterium T265]|nr:glycosyl transferase [Gemmatimonadetes bacterium T265]